MIGLFRPLSKVFQRFTSLDESFFQNIEDVLIQADLGVKATDKIVSGLREKAKQERIKNSDDLMVLLKNELTDMLKSHPAPSTQHPALEVKLIVGVNGTGKTTTIAKMAYQAQREGKKVLLVAADTYRAAAIEQLSIWADRLGVEMIKHQRGADPGAVVYDAIEAARARGVDLVLVDTAGRLHTQANLMEELKKLKRVAENQAPEASIETLLVIDATTGQNGLSQARLFNEALEIDGIILTKLDGTAKGGIVVAVQEELTIPVTLIGLGEHLEDLEDFNPTQFVEALLVKG